MRRLLPLAVVLGTALGGAGSAQGAFPGEPGKIVFHGDGVYVAEPDFSVVTRVSETGYDPAFSADGQRIVFGDRRLVDCRPSPIGEICDVEESLFTINADGTGRQRITSGFKDEYSPAFPQTASRSSSPGGRKATRRSSWLTPTVAASHS